MEERRFAFAVCALQYEQASNISRNDLQPISDGLQRTVMASNLLCSDGLQPSSV